MENSTVIIDRLIMATLRLLSIIGPSIWECNYYNLALGPIEIILPSGHIIPPLGCIILPSGRLDLRSTASLRQDNASRGWNNVAFWQDNFYCPSGLVVIISQYGWDWGVSVPGAFKLDHLQPFKPILFWNFSNFFTFILGSQFLLPQRANNGKGEFSQLPIWMRLRGFSAWSTQTGPFAAL